MPFSRTELGIPKTNDGVAIDGIECKFGRRLRGLSKAIFPNRIVQNRSHLGVRWDPFIFHSFDKKRIMKNILILLCLSTLVMFACSKEDQCDDADCVHGSCHDGSCACEDGWTGPECDQFDFDFLGTYDGYQIILSDCNAAADNRVGTSDVNGNWCSNTETGTYCFRINLDLLADGTFELTLVTEEVINGLRLTIPKTGKGTYTVSGDEISICEDGVPACNKLVVNPDLKSLDWLISTDDPDTGCTLSYNIRKIS